jgi:hypothetical protein
MAAGDDAGDVEVFPLSGLPQPLAFDHAHILDDYARMYGNTIPARGDARPSAPRRHAAAGRRDEDARAHFISRREMRFNHKVLFVASEMYPFPDRGPWRRHGALPVELKRQGVDVALITPTTGV